MEAKHTLDSSNGIGSVLSAFGAGMAMGAGIVWELVRRRRARRSSRRDRTRDEGPAGAGKRGSTRESAAAVGATSAD